MNKQERPATLRRAPRPAADENVDPVDTLARRQRPAPSTAQQPTAATTRGGRREATMPFSTRLAPDVVDLIDQAAASQGITIRAVIEDAIRTRWGRS